MHRTERPLRLRHGGSVGEAYGDGDWQVCVDTRGPGGAQGDYERIGERKRLGFVDRVKGREAHCSISVPAWLNQGNQGPTKDRRAGGEGDLG